MKLTVRRLKTEQLDEIRPWYDDAELARRLTYPTAEWHATISGEDQQCWVVLDDLGTIVATMQVDREGDVGHIALAVKPELRGRGIGSAALRAFITGPGSQYSVLEGRIEPDNAASIACVQKCGFRMGCRTRRRRLHHRTLASRAASRVDRWVDSGHLGQQR